MPTLVADCPRCGAKNHTFDVTAHVLRGDFGNATWQRRAEVFSICRNCVRPTIFIIEVKDHALQKNYENGQYWISKISLNQTFRIDRYVSLREVVTRKPPEHCPEPIPAIFEEAAVCMAVGCYNAAGTMFRLCLDAATRSLLPAQPVEGEDAPAGGPNRRQRRDLGLRLRWLIENGSLAADLADLAEIVREDGNDGAHAGNLTKEDAEDLADFTELLLERLFTEPGRVALARARRLERREQH